MIELLVIPHGLPDFKVDNITEQAQCEKVNWIHIHLSKL